MEELHNLKNFGLADNDIFVYRALLALGSSKTGPIIRRSGVGSSRTYESLARLSDKGLASYEVHNNVRFYRAEPPTELLQESTQNLAELSKLEKAVKQTVVEKVSRNFINTYTGKRAFRMAFMQHVESLRRGEIISVIAYSKQAGRSRELRTFLKSLDDLMTGKKCKMRMRLEKSMRPILEKDRHYKEYITRYLPEGYFGPMAVNISGEQIMLSTWGEEPVAIVIKNPVIVKSYTNNFEFLWQTAKA
jgi:sugar-specific transcriptional regulator TrmB